MRRGVHRPPVHPKRRPGGDCLGDPEGVPHPVRAKRPAQEEGGGEDDHHIAAQGDDQGLAPFAQALQGSGGGDRYGGDHEPCTDDP